MRCLGVTKNKTDTWIPSRSRCKRPCGFLYCPEHRPQLFYGLVSLFVGIATFIIFADDLAGALKLSKPIDTVQKIIKKDASTLSTLSSKKSIFPANDSTNFNVLIIRFETYTNTKETDCIGRSISQSINTADANLDLPLALKAVYADSIGPPTRKEEALALQDRHNADLIIYGLVQNIEKDCAGADVCFRYNINDLVITQLSPAIEPKKSKHDLQYIRTTPMEIEQGEIRFDKETLNDWVAVLTKVKAGKNDEAFLGLDKILNQKGLTKEKQRDRYFNIGITYISLRQDALARESFLKALELESNENEVNANLSNITFWLGFSSRNSVHSSTETVKYLKMALRHFDKTKQSQSFHAAINNSLGFVLGKNSEFKEAAKYLRKAIVLDSTKAHMYDLLAAVLFSLNQTESAIQQIEKALEIDSNFVLAYITAGRFLSQKGELEKAVDYLQNALNINPMESDANFYMGTLLSNNGNPVEAENYFRKAIVISPNVSLYYENLGIALARQGQTNKAIQEFMKAIELDSVSVVAYTNLGLVFYHLGQLDKAEQNFEYVIKLNPNSVLAYLQLAQVSIDKNNMERAKILSQNAIKIDPNYVESYLLLADIFYSSGKFNDALKVYQQFLISNPNHLNNDVIRGHIQHLRKEKENQM